MASAVALTPTPRRRRWWTEGRQWHATPTVALPAKEAGRDWLTALLNGPGGPRQDLKTAWDDRAETSVKAVYRYLWRQAHARKSAAVAVSVDQLIAGLMPVMGWLDRGSLEDNRSSYSKSVRRWLDRLAAMRLLEWRGVRDNRNRWWRTELLLLPAPAPDPDTLAAARARMRTFSRREMRRRLRNPCRRRELTRVIERSARPCAARRRRLGRARGLAVRAARATPSRDSNLLPNPFGASTTSKSTPFGIQFEIELNSDTSAAQTGARVVDNDRVAVRNANKGCANELNSRPWSPSDGVALLLRVAAREAALAEGRERPSHHAVFAVTMQRALATLEGWPQHRPVPNRILSEAFEAVTGRPAKLAHDNRHRAQLQRAVARYERCAEQRPNGWPPTGGAALARCIRDVTDDAESVAYAIGRLDVVSKQMAAAAKRSDPLPHYERRARRQHRRAQQTRTTGPLTFRRFTADPGWCSDEQIRNQGAELFLAGDLPGTAGLIGFQHRDDSLLDPTQHRRRDNLRTLIAWTREQLQRRDKRSTPSRNPLDD